MAGMNPPYYKKMQEALDQDKKVLATAFPYEGVRIVHDDGSILNLRFAFVKRQPDRWVFVFTEHLGVIVLHEADLKTIEVRERTKKRRLVLRKEKD